jgi:cytochrome P450
VSTAEVDLLDGLDLYQEFEKEVGDWVTDPYPQLAELLAQGAVYRGDVLVEHLGFGTSMLSAWPEGPPVTILGFEESRRALLDAEHFSSKVYDRGSVKTMGIGAINSLDPPEHSVHRRLIHAAFSKRTMDRWQHEIAEPLVDAQLSDVYIAGGRSELMRDFCRGYPISVIHYILGLPREDLAQMHQWAVGLLLYRTQLDIAIACAERISDLVAEQVALRHEQPRDDMISTLCQARLEDGSRMSDDEIVTFLRTFLNAGSETTASALGSLFWHLLTNPEQVELVRADRGLVGAAIDESLRLEPPLGVTWRLCAADVELGDVQIKAGSPVAVCLAAANRDARHFADPERFDVRRAEKGHLTFGFGQHICLGQHVARMELTVAVNRFLDRLPELRLDEAEPAPHLRGFLFRSPRTLPIRWE